MPLYNTATAATAIGVAPKWLDNLLSHNDIPGVQSDSQGVSRRLSFNAVTHIALTKELVDSLNMPVSTAIRVAANLLEHPDGTGSVPASPLRMTLDLEQLRTEVLARLAHAVELAPTRRRGRPPKR